MSSSFLRSSGAAPAGPATTQPPAAGCCPSSRRARLQAQPWREHRSTGGATLLGKGASGGPLPQRR